MMENMDKGLTLPKWVLTVQPKIPQMPQNFLLNLSAQAQKLWMSMEKGFIALGVRSPWVKEPGRHESLEISHLTVNFSEAEHSREF